MRIQNSNSSFTIIHWNEQHWNEHRISYYIGMSNIGMSTGYHITLEKCESEIAIPVLQYSSPT